MIKKYVRLIGLLGCFFCASSLPLFSNESNINEAPQEYKPWFIGSILAPGASNMPPGHGAIEIAMVACNRYAKYTSSWHRTNLPNLWSIGPNYCFHLGIADNLGMEIIGAVTSNFCKSANYTYLTDTIFRLGIQLLTDKKDTPIPDLRLVLQEIFPTGNYEKYKPSKYDTDDTGAGSFQTGFHLACQKFFPRPLHSYRIRGSVGYIFPARVSVKGINAYGGDANTKAKVTPGSYLSLYLLYEYLLSHSWAVGLESHYRQGMKGKTNTTRGKNITSPSYCELFLAPQIEHTYSENFGARLGGWFSIIGRNRLTYAVGFLAVTWKF